MSEYQYYNLQSLYIGWLQIVTIEEPWQHADYTRSKRLVEHSRSKAFITRLEKAGLR